MENNQFEEFDNVTLLTDKEVFFKIFTHPKQSLTYIHENHYENYLTIILFSIGVFSSLERNISKWNNLSGEKIIIYIVLAIIFGGLFGWISFSIFGYLTYLTGKWMKGRGKPSDFVRIYAYSSIPKYFSLIMIILQVIIYNFFLTNYNGNKVLWNFYMVVIYGLAVIQMLILGWIIVLNVIGISIVQNFSYGKAFLNYFVSIAVIIIPIVLIILLFTL